MIETMKTATVHKLTGTFERWAKYRKLFADIQETLSQSNGVVQVNTVYRSTTYTAKHASWFSVDKAGVYVKSGKQTICISGCNIRFGKIVKN